MLAFIIIVGIALLAILLLVSGNDKNAGSPAEQHAKAHGQPVNPAEPKKSTRQLIREAELLSLAIDLNIVEACNAAAPSDMPSFIKDYIRTNFIEVSMAGINFRTGIADIVGKVHCVLVPEPTNDYDHDAIRIETADTNIHVGYVPSDLTSDLRDLLGDSLTTSTFFGTISQGESEDYDDDSGLDGYEPKIKSYYYGKIYIPCNKDFQYNG